MRRVWFITLALFVVAAMTVDGQTRKSRPRVVPKKVKANVTVDTVPTDTIVNVPITEADAGTWNMFEIKEIGLEMMFPVANQNIQDDTLGRVRSFHATTNKATYLLAIRDLASPISNEGLETFLNEIIKNTFGERGTKLIDQRNLSYAGRIGKQLTTERNAHRTISRLYVLNGKLFAMSVTLDQKDYDQTFEKWITKFFDSFRVKVPVFNEA
jgi:hypothetical protein